MHDMKKLILALLAILSFTALQAQNKKTSVEVDYMEASSRYLEPTQAFMTIPVVADLQVSKDRITYTEKDAFVDYPVTEDMISLVPNFKQIALCRAARAYKADVILGATVDVITNSKGRFEITITGYPASYVNFRSAKTTDFDVIRQGNALYSEKTVILDTPQSSAEISEVEVKKTKKDN